ncbi:hypothetical protein DOY81_007285, partial [Sarcophaga bullata]
KMLKILLCVAMCSAILATAESADLLNRVQRTTTNESTTDNVPAGYYKSNNLPQVEKDCRIRFGCKKKLKAAETPKPCLKFCVTFIECPDGKRTYGVAGQCLELNEELVTQEYNDCKKDERTASLYPAPVAMIDFPCQPGYLPDSRGRCREVW